MLGENCMTCKKVLFENKTIVLKKSTKNRKFQEVKIQNIS